MGEQTAAPTWVRARALAAALLVFQGTMVVGSFVWGALAECFGNGSAPSVAALALVCGLAAAWRWSLHQVQRLDLSPTFTGPIPRWRSFLIRRMGRC